MSNESNINRSWLPRCFHSIITITYPSISWARQKFCTENISSVSRSYGVHQLKDKSWSPLLVIKTITWGRESYTCTDLVHTLHTEQWRKHVWLSGLCSSRARCPLVPNFCPWATRKSQIFHANHMLGTLDFTVSEHWAPFNFP